MFSPNHQLRNKLGQARATSSNHANRGILCIYGTLPGLDQVDNSRIKRKLSTTVLVFIRCILQNSKGYINILSHTVCRIDQFGCGVVNILS